MRPGAGSGGHPAGLLHHPAWSSSCSRARERTASRPALRSTRASSLLLDRGRVWRERCGTARGALETAWKQGRNKPQTRRELLNSEKMKSEIFVDFLKNSSKGSSALCPAARRSLGSMLFRVSFDPVSTLFSIVNIGYCRGTCKSVSRLATSGRVAHRDLLQPIQPFPCRTAHGVIP
jgi:hypothetical protein